LIYAFPNDQTIALNKIDYHLYKEEYFEAIQVINQLQNETEDDFLNFMKAGIAFEDKNYDLALNLYTYTINNYPNFFEGQVGYLSTLIVMKNYIDTTHYLDTMIAEGYDKQGLSNYIEEEDENGVNILKAYSKSKNFLDWKKNK
jgi:tetratricopeptide (TPR) repeat protein